MCVCVCVCEVCWLFIFCYEIFSPSWSEVWRDGEWWIILQTRMNRIKLRTMISSSTAQRFASLVYEVLAPTYSLDVICNIQYGAFNALTVSSRTRSIQSHKTRHSTDHTKNKKSITSSNILVPTSISFCLYLCLSSTPCIQSSFLSIDLCRYSI